MHGPRPTGHWTKSGPDPRLKHLRAGERYCVYRAFDDWDGDTHPAGEAWVFLGTSFLPHDDGRSIFLSLDGTHEWLLPMQSTPQEQGPILDHLEQYIMPAPGMQDATFDALRADVAEFEQDAPRPHDPAWVRGLFRRMVEIDQHLRGLYLDAMQRHDQQAMKAIGPELVQADFRNRERLRAWLADHEWPTPHSHGAEACQHAWLIAIHADLDAGFMREVLAQMEPLLARGDVAPVHYAALFDRCAIIDGRPQRYGMFYQLDEDGERVPYPTEHVEGLAERRARLGLGDEVFHR